MKQIYFNHQPVEGAIEVTSTSKVTAKTEPIALREPTDGTRLTFQPTLVDNPKCPENSVSGKIIYERKSKSDDRFPTEQGADFVSKGTVHVGDAMVMSLNTSETRELYLGLQKLYQIYEDMGGVQGGTTSFVQVDNTVRALLGMLRNDASAARLLGNSETFELAKELIKLLTQGISHDELAGVLGSLEDGSIHGLSDGIGLEMLERAAREMEANLANNSEQYWQSEILESYPWVISQVFSTPCMLFGSKAYVGSKAIDNSGGNVIDFLYQNKMTSNVSLVEIKTPCTKLLGTHYRARSYSASQELSGAVNQILSYKQSLLRDYATLRANSSDAFEAFNPTCVILIGNTREFAETAGRLNSDKLGSFENFRSAINGVTIVTFDELLQKVKDLISILKSGEADNSTAEIYPAYTANRDAAFNDWGPDDMPF